MFDYKSLTFLDLDWDKNKPQIRVRQIGSENESSQQNIVGETLNFRVNADQSVCKGHIAYEDHGFKYIDCFELPTTGSKCENCKLIDGHFAANMHQAHKRELNKLDPRFRKHLQKEHLLYVAGFRDGSIKVGTTATYRKETRLNEQGAWKAIIVAKCADGLAVRELEDLVTQKLGVVQTVNMSKKLKGHANPVDDSKLQGDLEKTAKSVHELVEELKDDRIRSDSELWSFSPLMSWADVGTYPLNIATGSHKFTIKDLNGKIALVELSDSNVGSLVIDVSRLFGKVLETEDVVEQEISVQGSLF